MNEEIKHKQLRQHIENATGCKPKTPRDFDYLVALIFTRTKEKVSATTLKRFWGYIEKEQGLQIRTTTLNILSQFAGFYSWADFCSDKKGISGSNFVVTNSINSESIAIGTIIRLLWEPGRCVSIRFEGSNIFTVIESVNSKLAVGDTFHCSNIVEGQELVLTNLIHPGMAPCSYICGRCGGIKFTVL